LSQWRDRLVETKKSNIGAIGLASSVRVDLGDPRRTVQVGKHHGYWACQPAIQTIS
jgi:hypothetical protein